MSTKTKDRPAQPPAAKTIEHRAAGEPAMDVATLLSTATARVGGSPSMTPPGEAEVEANDVGITAWHNSKKVTATWSNASNLNAWAAVEGLGWRRIAHVNESSFLTMVLMAAHAEAEDRPCNIRIDADNKIHEIYVF